RKIQSPSGKTKGKAQRENGKRVRRELGTMGSKSDVTNAYREWESQQKGAIQNIGERTGNSGSFTSISTEQGLPQRRDKKSRKEREAEELKRCSRDASDSDNSGREKQ